MNRLHVRATACVALLVGSLGLGSLGLGSLGCSPGISHGANGLGSLDDLPPAVATTPVVRWRAVVVPQLAIPIRVSDEPGGGIDVTAGGYRFQLDDEGIHTAGDTTLFPIVAHARNGDHWLFVTEDGAMFESEGFLGSLDRKGDTQGHALRSGFDSTGVLAVADSMNDLWFARAGEGIVRAPAPIDVGLIDTGFVDERFGVTVISPGLLLRTLDGGHGWSRVSAGNSAVRIVYPSVGGFVLDTTDGTMFVGETGDAVRANSRPPEPDREISNEMLLSLRDTVRSDAPGALSRWMASGITLSDGRVAIDGRNDIFVTGTRAVPTTVPRPEGTCRLLPWGNRLLAQCHEGSQTTLQLLDADHWTPLRSFSRETRVVAAHDGSSLVISGPCELPDRLLPTHLRSVCWYDGHSWQDVELRGISRLLAMRGSHLLHGVIDDPESPGAQVYYVTDLAGGAEASHRVFARSTEEESDQPREIHADLLADGTLVASGRSPVDTDLMLAMGAVDALPLRFKHMQAGADSVAFADQHHGMAVDDQLNKVWITENGADWNALELPIDGAKHLPYTASMDRGSPVVSCSAISCVVPSRLVWAPETYLPPAGESTAPYAAQTPANPVLQSSSRPDPWGEGFNAGRRMCVMTQPPNHTVDHPAAPNGQPVANELVLGADGWIQVRRQGEPGVRGAGRFSLRWSGRDDRGVFQGNSSLSAFGPVAASTVSSTNTPVEYSVRLLSRSLALLERCVSSVGYPRCDLVMAPSGGVARVVGEYGLWLTPDPRGYLGDHTPVMRAALPLGDGGAIVHLSPNTYSIQYDQLVRLDARGSVIAKRGFTWGRQPTTRLLGLSHGEPGLAYANADSPRVLHFLTLDPTRDDVTVSQTLNLPNQGIGLCHPGTTFDSLLMTEEREYGMMLYIQGRILDGETSTRTRLGFVGGTPCVHSVMYWSNNHMHSSDSDLFASLGGVPVFRAMAEGRLQSEVLSPTHAPVTILCSGATSAP